MNIGEKSSIPLVWLFAAIGVVSSVGGGILVWGTRLEAKTLSNESSIHVMGVKQDRYSEDMQSVRENIVEIKTILKGRRHGKETN